MDPVGWRGTGANGAQSDARSYLFGPFRLDLRERSLHRHDAPVPLGGRAFDILTLLVERAGDVVRHDEIVARVWSDVVVSPGTLRVHVTALRKALGCRPDRTRFIANVPGRGYAFIARVAVPQRPQQVLATPNTADAALSAMIATPRPEELTDGPRIEIGPSLADMTRIVRTVFDRAAGAEDMPNRKLALAAAVTLLASLADAAATLAHAETARTATEVVTHYRSETIDGVSLFYREAGPANGPVVLLLHGFPTSSHMFRNLIPTLADRYHVVAPDYPGFGQSAAPDHKQFAYTFAHFATLVDGLMQKLRATRYAMYVMDYGAPVGYRLALLHPERVSALVVQNGNAYVEGLGPFWDPIKAYWKDGSETHRRALGFLVAPETTKFQYTDGVSDVSRISPDNWVHDQALLDRPGNRDIQLDLFYDYGSNVPLYPDFQSFFRKYQPPTLIVWGKNDKIFPATGAEPYLRDLPKAELHLLDTGHFALEDKLDVMAPMIRDFLDRSIAPR